MRRAKTLKYTLTGLFILWLLFISTSQAAEDSSLFLGRVNAEGINVRVDSTINSEILCTVNQGDTVEVVRQFYEWYKIKLPQLAPSFIHKSMLSAIDNKTARVIKDNVNIRLGPNNTSVILGKAENAELIEIVEDKGDWYRIKPVNNSFAWIHSKFIDRVADALVKEERISSDAAGNKDNIESIIPQQEQEEPYIIIEGLIKPKLIKKIATHKLITADKKIFLLKSGDCALSAFNHKKVRAKAKLSGLAGKTQILEIENLELLH